MAIRCVLCDHVVDDTTGMSKCPSCGTKSLPVDTNDDVMVKINWHELRILGIWAENWARRIEKDSQGSVGVVDAIATRLEKQFPEKTPVTLCREIAKLQDVFPSAMLVTSDNEVIVPPVSGSGGKVN